MSKKKVKSFAIMVPMFLVDENRARLLVDMAAFVQNYMDKEGIKSPEEWDKRVDDEDFKMSTIQRILNDYGNACLGHWHLDMIKYAPIFLECVNDLFYQDRRWFDNIITTKTNFKYENLPILYAAAHIIIQAIDIFAPDYIKFIENYKRTHNK